MECINYVSRELSVCESHLTSLHRLKDVQLVLLMCLAPPTISVPETSSCPGTKKKVNLEVFELHIDTRHDILFEHA